MGNASFPVFSSRDCDDRVSSFIWYSGATAKNKVGSLMFYASGAQGYSWYASFREAEEWTVSDEFQITRRELLDFEKLGRLLECARYN